MWIYVPNNKYQNCTLIIFIALFYNQTGFEPPIHLAHNELPEHPICHSGGQPFGLPNDRLVRSFKGRPRPFGKSTLATMSSFNHQLNASKNKKDLRRLVNYLGIFRGHGELPGRKRYNASQKKESSSLHSTVLTWFSKP